MKPKLIRNYGSRIATVLTAAFLLAAGTSMTASAAPASYARPAHVASVTVTPAAATCSFARARLGYRYFSPAKSHGLDWWGRSNSLRNQGTTIPLERVSTGSDRDCFRPQGGFGNGRVQLRMYNSALCLAVAGRKAGTRIVLSNCLTHPISELFAVFSAGKNINGWMIRSAATGLCADLSNGFRAGSLLVQKPCKIGNVNQAWFVH